MGEVRRVEKRAIPDLGHGGALVVGLYGGYRRVYRDRVCTDGRIPSGDHALFGDEDEDARSGNGSIGYWESTAAIVVDQAGGARVCGGDVNDQGVQHRKWGAVAVVNGRYACA